MNPRYGPNLGSLIRTKLDNGNQMNSSPCPKEVRPTKCDVKVMFIGRMALMGVILHHAVPPRQTVNAADHCTFLRHHLRPALRRKRLLVVQNPISLHDNARSHTFAVVTHLCMGGSPGELSGELVMQEKQKKGWRMNCDVGEAMDGLENEL